ISVAKHIVPIAVLGLAYSWTSVTLSLPWSVAYAPLHLYSSFVLFLFLRRLGSFQIATGFVPDVLRAAIVAWIAAGLLFPLAWLGVENVLVTYAGIEATAVSVLGASLFILLLRESHRTAEQHHKVSLLMASVVQHDIRNFLQTAISALEMATDNDKQASLWIAAAIDSLVRAADFVKEMRDISAEITRFERVEMPVDLASMIKTVVDTLKHIYVERPRTVQIQVPHPFLVISNQLLKQVLWNIIDNSFKHGSDTLTIWSNVSGSRGTLFIEDRAGGVDEEIRRYVNNLSVSEDQMPGVGLGVILIRGLSQLAHARVTLQNVTDESVVVGCRYVLDFRLAESV
ncbi:MAG: sensor histidine kinase, partial [Candidatus Thorarchaeota archaeon]